MTIRLCFATRGSASYSIMKYCFGNFIELYYRPITKLFGRPNSLNS